MVPLTIVDSFEQIYDHRAIYLARGSNLWIRSRLSRTVVFLLKISAKHACWHSRYVNLSRSADEIVSGGMRAP
jgi:hypothetical protein